MRKGRTPVKDDEPLIPKKSSAPRDAPPVPVSFPMDGAGQDQFLQASNIQKAIDVERFRAYSKVSRILHFTMAGLLLLHDFVTPRTSMVYEFAGRAEYKVLPVAHPWLEAWLSTERLIPLFVIYQTFLFHYLLPERILSARTKLMVEGWIDLLWITVAVAITGGVESPFVFLYLLVILNAAPTQTRVTAVAKVIAATILLAAAFSFGDPGDKQSMTMLIWPVSFLWTASYLSGAFENITRSLNEQILRETVRDDTTGLYTFKFFAALPDRKSDWPYSIVLFDADNLKLVNDNFGHEKGTDLIRHAAEAIRAAAREGDVCARLGGDEFIVRLKGATREGALKYAERVRELAGRLPVELPGGRTFPVNLSAGCASCPTDGKSMPDIIRKADLALYASKDAGRNRASSWTPDLEQGSGSQFLGALVAGADRRPDKP